jgi:hypothetical protein
MGESEYEKLARLIKEESEDIRTEIQNSFADVRKDLGRHEGKMDAGFARIDHELASIRSELKSIRADTAALQASTSQHEGYAKEIDHILERVAAIEKYLGITHAAHN